MHQTKPIPLRQIVTLGGAGFGTDGKTTALDEYILKLTRKRRPRVCFLPTASGDNPDYIAKFHEAYCKDRAVASHLTLFSRDATDPAEHLLAQDVIYVGGGNTANALAVWRLHGVEQALRQAWRRGIILCGISAGMNCWFERCSTDSFGPLQLLNDGLGLLKGCACPHYDAEEHRRPTLRKMVAAGAGPAFAADNGAAFHWIGRKLHAAVASRPAAHCYSVRLLRGEVVEQPLPTHYLGSSLR